MKCGSGATPMLVAVGGATAVSAGSASTGVPSGEEVGVVAPVPVGAWVVGVVRLVGWVEVAVVTGARGALGAGVESAHAGALTPAVTAAPSITATPARKARGVALSATHPASRPIAPGSAARAAAKAPSPSHPATSVAAMRITAMSSSLGSSGPGRVASRHCAVLSRARASVAVPAPKPLASATSSVRATGVDDMVAVNASASDAIRDG